MVKITLPDGNIQEFEKETNALEIAKSISEGLARMAIAAKINGELADLTTTIKSDSTVEIITSKNDESLDILRHSVAHILAQAIIRLYPSAKRTIGPSTENGFFYDFDLDEITEEDLPKVEQEMQKIVKEDLEITFNYKTKEEALEFYNDNEYKQEIINAIFDKKLNEEEQLEGNIEGDKLKFYKQGEYEDLCAGPHIPRTGVVKAFKLDRITKAYWRGNSDNKQLSRIYGTAFWKKTDMEDYYKMLEEAKRRDHRIISQKMKLFTISDLVGSGLPLFQPNGMVIRKEIEDFLWDLHRTKGYKRVWTPHVAKKSLYETSGHADKFGDELFKVKGKDDEFFMKPMNCPHHMQIFADNYFSYKDMPIRYFEPATIYRDELSGALSGLTRVRSITQDDGHLFCRVDQIREEVTTIVKVIREFFGTLGMTEDFWVSLSIRDDDKSKYLGSDDVWIKAEEALEEAAKENELPYRRIEGEAAFYGPKLDFMFKDCIGREWQLSTIQCDFNLPERFDLFYVNEDSKKERPVVIHRAIAGSLERFMGIIIEHFEGKFPFWLAPVQMKILNIADRHVKYCDEIKSLFEEEGFRIETNYDHLTMNNKVRQAQEEKVPYIIVLGDKDEENKTVSVRNRDNKTTVYSIEEFIKKVRNERETKSLLQLA
mgnify:CR=1 FL=1